MKIVVKTLKGTNFEIEVKPEDTVVDVKRCIESIRGAQVYPAARQMLIHQGKVLEDGTTLEENGVVENNFVVVMLSKIKSSPDEISGQSTSTTATEISALPTTIVASPPPTPTTTPAALQLPEVIEIPSDSELYDQTTSHLVAGNNLEGLIQQLLDMGGGTWDRDTVVRALRAAFNNPERAVEYLYTGIPENAVVPPASGSVANPPIQPPPEEEAATTSVVVVPSSGPNANPLDLFPQGLPGMGSNAAGAGSLDFLHNNPQFQGLRGMVQTNPQLLQPLLQELGKQNPDMMRKIQENEAEFLRLINDPVEGEGGNLENQELDDAMQTDATSQVLTVTPEEREAIERLQGMGFDQALVLEVYFLCNKNEELAANYLLDHMNQD